MKKLKKMVREALHLGLSPVEVAETLLNGNISDFKAWVRKASKAEFLEALDSYAQTSGDGYIRSLDYFKKLLHGVVTPEAFKFKSKYTKISEVLSEPPKAKGQSIKMDKKPTVGDDIDEPATGWVGRRKPNTGKQHTITAYDDQWESLEQGPIKLKEYVPGRFNERDKVLAVSPFSTRNEIFDGVVEKKSGDRYFVKPSPESLKKLDYAQAGRLKDGIWLTGGQMKKQNTLTQADVAKAGVRMEEVKTKKKSKKR